MSRFIQKKRCSNGNTINKNDEKVRWRSKGIRIKGAFKILHTLLLDTSVDSLDWKDYGVDNIIDTVLNHKHLGNGSIILCHNGAKYTAEALDSLITGLQDKGYEIVPISELIYKDNYHMDVNGRQIEDEKSKEWCYNTYKRILQKYKIKQVKI